MVKEQFTPVEFRKLSVAELYKKVKIDPKIFEEISKIGDEKLERLIQSKYPLPEETEKEVEIQKDLEDAYYQILTSLKYYLDLKESYYPIITCWIIGTYFHKQMLTYPYLYFNASKESGKSRSVRLIIFLAWEGEMVNSMTEAVLFRTKGTLGIDEFERAARKGNENFIELLNSAYKKGVKVKRMKKSKGITGTEEMVVEDFEVFRPIVLANIWGMDSVLEDRTLPMYIEKTSSDIIPNLLEIWEFDEKLQEVKKNLQRKCSLCNVVTLYRVYLDWNEYLINNYITTGTNNYTKLHLFKKIKKTGIKGRMLELSFPLILVADMIDEKIVDEVVNSLKDISIEKTHEAFLENKDILLIDMISQIPQPVYWTSIKKVTEMFREFTQINEDWLNEKWVGRAVKRNILAKEKKRTERGIEVLFDIDKALEKIKIFKKD